MADALRTVGVRLPATWRAVGDAASEPAPLKRPGIELRPEWRGKHEDGRSELVVFSVRLSPTASMDALRKSLKQDLMAESGHVSGDSLAWVSQIEGEYFPAIMRTPSAGGHPLIWLARLPEDTVPARMPEIMQAIEASEWVWA